MLYIKVNNRIWALTEHQIGFFLYMLILIVWYIMKLNEHTKERNYKKQKPSSISKLRKQIRLKVHKIQYKVNKKRIKWLKKRRQKIDAKIERLNINNSLLFQKQIETISSLRGGDLTEIDDKKYLRKPDFARCIGYIDPDRVYEIHDPVVLKYVRKLIVLDKKNLQIIDVAVAIAASYKSQSILQYTWGLAFTITTKSKGVVNNIFNTAIIWAPNGIKPYLTVLGYIIAGFLTLAIFAQLIANGLLLSQIGAGIFSAGAIYYGTQEITSIVKTDCQHVISSLPASSYRIMPTIERPISYILDHNPSPHRIFVAGDEHLTVKKLGKPIPEDCFIGENNINVHQENNPFGNNLACLKNERDCKSILEEVSQKIENIRCKDNLKSFEEATDVCARYKNSNKPNKSTRLKISKSKKSSAYQLRGRTTKVVSNTLKSRNPRKCYPRYNVPLRARTKTLKDLKEKDYQEFLNSDGTKQLEKHTQKSRNILRERYNFDENN